MADTGAAPFYGPDWTDAWFSAFGSGDLRMATLRREGALEAVLPLQAGRGGLRATANWHTPVYGPVGRDQGTSHELLLRLFGQESRSVDMWGLDATDEVLGMACEAARESGREVATRPVMSSPYLALDGSYDDFERGLSKNRRKGLRRCTRGLEREGRVTLDVETGQGPLAKRLEEAFLVEASGWKGERGTAIICRPETRQFYRDLAMRSARRGWLRLAFLRVDGQPIAFDFALECRGAWYSLKAGYHEAASRFGPGAVLLAMLVRRGYETGLRRVDLLGHADDFKLAWTNRAADRAWMRAFARGPAGRLEARLVGAREWARPAARQLRARVRR